jgi:hypothetical protein
MFFMSSHVSQAVGDRCSHAHLQLIGDPTPSHRRFVPQSLRHLNLLLIAFAPTFQFRCVPSPFLQFITQQALSFGHSSFGSLIPAVMRAHFAKKPVHPQPGRSLPGPFQIFRITALTVSPQRLLRDDQFGAHGIQVNVITDRPQIAVAAAVHDEGFIASAEEVAKKALWRRLNRDV